jgi:flagellar L-ring protein precursor FlgH
LIGANGNARQVGDLITVVVEESASTSIGATTDTSRTSDAAFEIAALLGADTSILEANPNMGAAIGLGGTSASTFTGDGSTTRDGSLSATITCTVTEVMPNGNLRIRGTKEVRVNREIQYLTLEGVVRPRDIRIDNTIQSNLIADARVEFTGNGVISDKQGQGWGTRIADTLWPF